jgi:hypothetical protein
MSLPRFETKKAPDYKVYHISGAMVGLNPNEGTIIIFQDKIVPKTNPDGSMVIDTIEREIIAELKMSPVQFKSLAQIMDFHVKEYEKMFGEIKIPSFQKQPPKGTMYG